MAALEGDSRAAAAPTAAADVAAVLPAGDAAGRAVAVGGGQDALEAAELVLEHQQVLLGADDDLAQRVARHAQDLVGRRRPVLAQRVGALVVLVQVGARAGGARLDGRLLLLDGVAHALVQRRGVHLDLLVARLLGASERGRGELGVRGKVRVEVLETVAVVLSALGDVGENAVGDAVLEGDRQVRIALDVIEICWTGEQELTTLLGMLGRAFLTMASYASRI